MKKSFRFSLAAIIISGVLAGTEACKKESKGADGDCKVCQSRVPDTNEVIDSKTVCTEEEEGAFRTKNEGLKVTCE